MGAESTYEDPLAALVHELNRLKNRIEFPPDVALQVYGSLICHFKLTPENARRLRNAYGRAARNNGQGAHLDVLRTLDHLSVLMVETAKPSGTTGAELLRGTFNGE